jgi:hypothetical protein
MDLQYTTSFIVTFCLEFLFPDKKKSKKWVLEFQPILFCEILILNHFWKEIETNDY